MRAKSTTIIHWPSVLQFGFNAFLGVTLWGMAVFAFIMGLSRLFNPASSPEAVPSTFILSTGLALVGSLLLSSAGFALTRLLGRPVTIAPWAQWGFLRKIFLLIPFVILAGHFASASRTLSWALLPPLHILAIAIPIYWFLSLGSQHLTAFSPQRVWGIFGAGLIVGPGLILVLETLGGLLTLVVAGLLLSREPGFLNDLKRLQTLLLQNPAFDPQTLLPFAETYLFQPKIILLGVGFIAVFVPFLEELIKPIGVWILWGWKLSPAEGFVTGMISGAGFALFESLFQAPQSQGWALLVSARMGTSLVHVLTAGITGWGIALAISSQRPFRLIIHYLISVSIHALWNGMTILAVAASLPAQQPLDFGLPWVPIAGIGLPILAGAAFITLIVINRGLRPAAGLPTPGFPPPPEPAASTGPEKST